VVGRWPELGVLTIVIRGQSNLMESKSATSMLMLPWVSNRTGMIITRHHTTKLIETGGEEDRVVEQDHQILDTVTGYGVILFKMDRFFGSFINHR
jgi:hypothetical protein